jgi:hypothetical protein
MAAETLSFKFSNPRIFYNSGTNYLVFNIMMKATANGTYLYSSQVICNIDVSNFNISSSPSFIKGFVAGQYSSFPNDPVDKYIVTTNWNSNNLNISVYGNSALNGESPSSGAYSQVTTSWQILGTVYAKISNLDGVAGINFQKAAIDGYQKFATGVAPYYSEYYSSPNLYEGYDFTDLYLNRIFSGGSGWTQAGGGVDWTASVNTSVWDTTTAAAYVGLNALANGLRIYPPGRLAIHPNTTLTVAGPLNNDAGNNGLIIMSDASGTGSLIHNTDNVPATIQTYISGSTNLSIYKYHFVSVPLTPSENPTSNLFLGSYLFEFMESTNQWHGLGAPTATDLSIYKGYMVYYPDNNITYSFAGKMNNGPFSVTIPYSGAGPNSNTAGFSLVPNPYPSAIDWKATNGWFKNNIDDAVYIWPSSSGAGATAENYASFVGGISLHDGSRYIAQGQSFFIHANNTDAGFQMDNPVRVHNPVAFFKEDEIIPNVLRIKTVANNAADEIVVRFVGVATTGFDGDWDAYKLVGGADAPQLNSVASDDSKLCINALPFNADETIVPLNFTYSKDTDVTFTASGMETFTSTNPIYLEDGLTGTMINLQVNPVYTFSYEPGSDENRFKLHFERLVTTSIHQEPTAGTAYISDRTLYIEVPSMKGQNTEVGVCNILGQQLDLNRVIMNGMMHVPFSLSPGVYFVRVTSSSQVFVTKLVNN